MYFYIKGTHNKNIEILYPGSGTGYDLLTAKTYIPGYDGKIYVELEINLYKGLKPERP